MLRIRFKVHEDSRPVIWPIELPYWVTGYDEHGKPILVAYVKDKKTLKKQWPDAFQIEEPQERDEVTFTDRFPRPDWYAPDAGEIDKIINASAGEG